MKPLIPLLVILYGLLIAAGCRSVDAPGTSGLIRSAPVEQAANARFRVVQSDKGNPSFDSMILALRWRDDQCVLHQSNFDRTAKAYDFFSGEEVGVRDASYVYAETDPPGAGILAFRDREGAERYVAGRGGRILTFPDLLEMTLH